MGRDEEALADRGASDLQPGRRLLDEHRLAGLCWPPRGGRTRRLLHRQHRHRRIQLRPPGRVNHVRSFSLLQPYLPISLLLPPPPFFFHNRKRQKKMCFS